MVAGFVSGVHGMCRLRANDTEQEPKTLERNTGESGLWLQSIPYVRSLGC